RLTGSPWSTDAGKAGSGRRCCVTQTRRGNDGRIHGGFPGSNSIPPPTGNSVIPAFDRITRDPHVMGGRPCIRGYRITVSLIANLAANGVHTAAILSEYPDLEAEDDRQACEFARRTTVDPRV